MASRRWCASLGQEVVEEVLDNGLLIAILPKPGFQTRYATFATKYGGMDNAFMVDGKDLIKVPAGIAHFLEHKMFEQPNGVNILDVYSKMGVDCNAGTYKDRTVYLFSVTDGQKFAPAFDLLLDYVQTPYFTDENVAKEQGIIQQEIASGLDNPGTVAWTNFESSMYHNHPAGINIIGTAESVSEITKEHLYLCHKTFYHPSNMMVVVSGDVDPDEVIGLVKKDMAERKYPSEHSIQKPGYDEPQTVRVPYIEKEMKVSRPTVIMGYKGPVCGARMSCSLDSGERLKRKMVGTVALEAILGKVAGTYWDLYSRGVVTRNFGFGFTDYGTACHMVVYTETDDADTFCREVDQSLARARDEGIDGECFELARRSVIGRVLSTLDSPEDLATLYIGGLSDGTDYLASREVLEGVTPADGTEFLRDMIAEDRKVISAVVPMGSGKVVGK